MRFYSHLLECLQKAGSGDVAAGGMSELHVFAMGQYYKRDGLADQSLLFFVTELFATLAKRDVCDDEKAACITIRSLCRNDCPLSVARPLLNELVAATVRPPAGMVTVTLASACTFRPFSVRMFQLAKSGDLQPLVNLYFNRRVLREPTAESLRAGHMSTSIALTVPKRPSLTLRLASSEVLRRPGVDDLYVSSPSTCSPSSEGSVGSQSPGRQHDPCSIPLLDKSGSAGSSEYGAARAAHDKTKLVLAQPTNEPRAASVPRATTQPTDSSTCTCYCFDIIW
jgi:hypothetical protein